MSKEAEHLGQGLHRQFQWSRSYGKNPFNINAIHPLLLTPTSQVDKLDTQFTALFQQQEFQNYTVAGQSTGLFKNAGTFSYLRVFGAGHEVPAYRVGLAYNWQWVEFSPLLKFGNLEYGEAAAQMFTQIMADQSLCPT